MKIIICTTPVRREPNMYPPFGSLALIQSLRLAGYDPYFYEIHALRPTFQEVVQFFADQAPDMVGISAVVSTAYGYTKTLALAIKEVSPHTKVVVGGNLAASAEILLRFCKIDACGIGEGERTIVELAHYWEDHKTTEDYSELQRIKGIAYLDKDGEVAFTGYRDPIPPGEFLEPDFTILEQFSKLDLYVSDPVLARDDFALDPRSYEPHRRGKMLTTVLTAKGCVSRCTFCHRWDGGYRHLPVDRIVQRIKFLIDRYNVGFVSFADENFGSDRRKTDELLEQIKPLDILWRVAGMRCRSVDLDLLMRMKKAGCVAVYYGMESGSPRILNIMEKNTTLQQNIDAARWTHEAGLYTGYQMVLAMPGEDATTVAETTDFLVKVTEFLPDPPLKRLGINYVEPLPGTAVYEYARAVGLIGKTLEDEERYLLRVSDAEAGSHQYINFTEYDFLAVQSWRPAIFLRAALNWHKRRNWKPVEEDLAIAMRCRFLGHGVTPRSAQRGSGNLGARVVRHPLFYRLLSWPFFFPLRALYPVVYVLLRDFRGMPRRRILGYLGEYLLRKLKKGRGLRDHRSLRRVMEDITPLPATKSEASMLPLRKGR